MGPTGRWSDLWDRVVAAAYDRVLAGAERSGLAADRSALLATASGRVLELGPGTGANLTHLPRGLRELVLVEPSPAMRARLGARVAAVRADDPDRLPPVRIVAGSGEQLPVTDASVDTVVATLVLCSVPDQVAVLAEVRRVLAPDGRLLLLEHVAAPAGAMRSAQRILTPAWRRIAQGCHLDRDTRGALRAARFDDTEVRDHRIPGARPVAPALVGTARPR